MSFSSGKEVSKHIEICKYGIGLRSKEMEDFLKIFDDDDIGPGNVPGQRGHGYGEPTPSPHPTVHSIPPQTH